MTNTEYWVNLLHLTLSTYETMSKEQKQYVDDLVGAIDLYLTDLYTDYSEDY